MTNYLSSETKDKEGRKQNDEYTCPVKPKTRKVESRMTNYLSSETKDKEGRKQNDELPVQ